MWINRRFEREFDRARQQLWDRYNMKSATTRLTKAAYAQLQCFCEEEDTTIHRLLRSFIAYIINVYYTKEHADRSLRNAEAHYLDVCRRIEALKERHKQFGIEE